MLLNNKLIPYDKLNKNFSIQYMRKGKKNVLSVANESNEIRFSTVLKESNFHDSEFADSKKKLKNNSVLYIYRISGY